MKTLIWILQLFLGVYFLAVGILDFIVPDGLPDLMSWMYEPSQGLHIFSGVVEILAGLGLLLPILVRPLLPLAALVAYGRWRLHPLDTSQPAN